MMKRIVFMAVLFVAAFANAQVSDDAVLVTINGRPSTVGEFMYIYEKNNQGTQLEKKTVDEYLDLFINFKLKVEAAREAGIDTTETFRKELSQYRSQATPKYMVNKEDEEAAIQKAYSRMQTDRRVSHIAIRCTESASADEEALARARIDSARVRVTTGFPVVKGKGKKQKILPGTPEDFNDVALQVSEDPSVKDNRGEVGYVRPFRFVFPFENAAYNTPIGQVSEVFRTPFGFHILKVEGEVPHEEIRASHIMMQTPRGNDSVEIVAKERIDSLYEVVKSGEDFAKVAFDFSQDRGSAMRGGDLGFFGRGQMVPEFEEAAFALTEQGQISEPIRSAYGWHIIRLAERRGVLPLDSIRQNVERQIKRSEYQDEINDAFVERLKAQYDFKENPDALNDLFVIGDSSTLGDSLFNAQAGLLNKELLSFTDNSRSQADFARYLKENPKSRFTVTRHAIEEKYKEYVATELRQYEDSRLEGKYKDLKNLITEYHDGIMLFEVSLREVWDKATIDTAGITAFFNQNRKNYLWDSERYKGCVVYCKDKETLKAAKQILKHANADSIQSYLNNRLNIDSIQYVRYERGLWEQGTNPAVDKFGFKLKNAEYTPDEALPFVYVKGKKLKGAEEYTDERGKVTADYQDYLEKEWIKHLREKYEIKINEEVLNYLRRQ